ncbi:MAG: diphosphate--fructose-6-phosphate 1-phosphotransferase [Moraxellaceae bacterium]|nr:diphosphate--fructose-6-phosphate 1-phosphotransferase [Moraxellaceae bacterium]
MPVYPINEKTDIVPALTDLLTAMEERRSPFEEAIRALPLPISGAFGDPAAPRVPNFWPGDESLPGGDALVQGEYPRCTTRNGTRVLEASGVLSAVPKGLRVAALFSGGPAAGGHNVLVGLRRLLAPGSTLLGVRGGPGGLLKGKLFEISDEDIARITNTGGFDFLGTDRTKIRSAEQIEAVRQVCAEQGINAIVIIGGDDSNTNAALLAEALFANVHPDGRGVQVIGVPKTIDGDLQYGDLLPISFGFDTATRIYGELVGNIASDTLSSRKYWHFVKLMGRAASHVTLEVALQTRPALTLVSEEAAREGWSLATIVQRVADTIIARADAGIHHGIVLIPEGLIDFVPEMHDLIEALNDALAHATDLAGLSAEQRHQRIVGALTPAHAKLLASLPGYLQNELLADRDSHGNLQLSLIATEQLLIDMVTAKLAADAPDVPFAAQAHFFGYEGRCGAPTLFDAAYCYNLGLTAASLILGGHTGYMATIGHLARGGQPLALPLTGMLVVEKRHGQNAFVIEKALVKVDGPAMRYFASRRDDWAARDCFASPGPRQLWGPTSGQIPATVALDRSLASLDIRFGRKDA